MNGSCAGGTGAFIDQMATLAENGRGGDGPGGPDGGKDLYHRLPLRRVRQERHPAPHQPGGQASRYCRQHLPGGGEPDHRRPGPGPAHQGPRAVPGRAADLFQAVCGRASTRLWASPELVRRTVCCLWLWARRFTPTGVVGPAESGGTVASSAACRRPTAPSRPSLQIRRNMTPSKPVTPRQRCRRRTSRRTTPSRVHIGIDSGSTTVKVAVIDERRGAAVHRLPAQSGEPRCPADTTRAAGVI